jgi:dihydrofolate reductase
MRQIVMLNRVSLDGFFAGPNGEIDWFIRDPEVDKAAHGVGKADTILFGRVTYQMFKNVWPKIAVDPNAPQDARTTANEINEMTKVVFSKTMEQVTWENSKLLKGNPAEEVNKLKQGNGLALMIFGSGTIVQQLTDAGLIDEYLLVVTPVVLGMGKPLFQGVNQRNLELLETKDFKSGNVLLHYSIDRKRKGETR